MGKDIGSNGVRREKEDQQAQINCVAVYTPVENKHDDGNQTDQ